MNSYLIIKLILISCLCLACEEETQNTNPQSDSIAGFGESDPQSCIVGEVDYTPSIGNLHLDDVEISYPINPPSSGDHRSQWARWGAYEELSPQRWLHNLEHGGIVILYQRDLDDSSYQEILTFLQNYPADEGGNLRWILAPYDDLSTSVALITWQWRMFLSCWNVKDFDAFVERTYRRAPEDIAGDGAYDNGWITR